MRSRLTTGEVTHARRGPGSIRNSFAYPIYYLFADLDELETLDHALRRFSYNRPDLVSFWDRDHGPRDGTALRPWIEKICSRVGIDLTGGHVMLLTFPRILSIRFYPVSFWYCYSADGMVRAVLAEVHNTFRDRHSYLLHDQGAPFDFGRVHTATKAFYVSPFIQVPDVTYEFELSEPSNTLSVRITDVLEGEHLLSASIDLKLQALTDTSLARTVSKHGPISAVALFRIHWQALKLLAKGAPFHPHEAPPDEEVSL